jgi:hypothetical protein
MRCRIVTKLGIDVTQPDNYHEHEESRSLCRTILWSVSLEIPTPQSYWVTGSLPLPDFLDGERDIGADQDQAHGEGSDGEANEGKSNVGNDPHDCERHELCTEPSVLREYAEPVELIVDPAVAIIARPEFKTSEYDEMSLQNTFVPLCHTIDPAVTPRFYLLVSKPSSTLDMERVSVIVPDHSVEAETMEKLRTQPLYLALRGLLKEHFAEIDPLVQLACDYCVSCTCTFDALVRRDAKAGLGKTISVFECTFPQPYAVGAPLFVRIFGRIEHYGDETLLLKCAGAAGCGADGCACFNLRDPSEDVVSRTPSSSSSHSVASVSGRLRQLDSGIPIPIETAASVVLWCDEVHSLEQQMLRCRRLLLARRRAVDQIHHSLMESAIQKARTDRQKDLASLQSLLTKLYPPEHSADLLAKLATVPQLPLCATISSDERSSLAFTAFNIGAYRYSTGLPLWVSIAP